MKKYNITRQIIKDEDNDDSFQYKYIKYKLKYLNTKYNVSSCCEKCINCDKCMETKKSSNMCCLNNNKHCSYDCMCGPNCDCVKNGKCSSTFHSMYKKSECNCSSKCRCTPICYN